MIFVKITQKKSEQISASLQFVQNEIRYLGIENGLSSHIPSSVSETLKRRYGDCKDKAVLFISILKALGIKAYPALVNTEIGPKINALLPSNNIFDHVIVKVIDGQESYWLDPTSRYQLGSIKDISEARFGYALVINPDVHSLEDMNVKSVNSEGRIHEKFSLLEGIASDVEYTVHSQFSGKLAEHMRYDLVAEGVAGTQQKYIDYYQKYYPGIKIEKQLVSHDTGNQVDVDEEYMIADFWEENESQQGYLADFYANYISSILIRSDANERNSPYYIGEKRKITQIIEVEFPDEGWKFDDDHVTYNNPVFDFEYQVTFDDEKNILLLNYQLNLKKEYVTGSEYSEYLQKRENVISILSYQIIKYFEVNSSSSNQINWSERVMLFFIGYLFVTLTLSIVVWLYERNNRPKDDDVLFYPISLERFYIFSILTFNLYIVYWSYKNWQYVKKSKNSNVMPFWRAMFQTLWFYAFNSYFKSDSEERFGKNKVYPNVIAGILLLVYILLSMAQSGSYFVFSLFALPLLFVPYVQYIKTINNEESILYKYNMNWSWRQIPVLLFCAPLLVVSTLGSLYLIPSSEVEKGGRIWSHDLRFMQREGILSANEKVQYFFSNDFWSIRADGNGFTENRVFSYWNDNDQLSVEKADYSNIKNIEVQYGKAYADDTIITISRSDDSTFMLFLSGDKSKDRHFVKEMTKLWDESKVAKDMP